MAKFDVLVGINLLREGLDLPEVSLVAILDADKEGFLRSETSLIQTIGRAARNAGGRVILYADSVTNAMDAALQETERRRNIQRAYNEAHGIVPQDHRQICSGSDRNLQVHSGGPTQGRSEDDPGGAGTGNCQTGKGNAPGCPDDGIRICRCPARSNHSAARGQIAQCGRIVKMHRRKPSKNK